DQIGRQIVGTMVMIFLAAGLAAVGDLEEPAEETTFAAMRAAAHEAARHGAHELAIVCRGAAENLMFHRHRLLARPRLCVRRCCDLPRRALWKDCFEPGRGFGSLSISKRIAPASGVTSTSFTSTASASW